MYGLSSYKESNYNFYGMNTKLVTFDYFDYKNLPKSIRLVNEFQLNMDDKELEAVDKLLSDVEVVINRFKGLEDYINNNWIKYLVKYTVPEVTPEVIEVVKSRIESGLPFVNLLTIKDFADLEVSITKTVDKEIIIQFNHTDIVEDMLVHTLSESKEDCMLLGYIDIITNLASEYNNESGDSKITIKYQTSPNNYICTK